MNFFFHLSNSFVKSKLSIPKFSNHGAVNKKISLFEAEIEEGKWVVNKTQCFEDDHFWSVNYQNKDDLQKIFFLATANEAALISEHNQILDLNNFTNTLPDYRANLMIEGESGGCSSYQSEYPFRMIQNQGSIYSDCGLLTTSRCKSVGVFIRNIVSKPIKKETNLYLYDQQINQVLASFKICTNEGRYIDLSDFKENLCNSFIYADNFLGIPVYIIEYNDGGLSMEHTHPPHEFVGGVDRFQLVKKLKDRINETIFTN
jgi:hypothetical protein